MSRAKLLLLLASLAFASPAHADYEFDPSDLPGGFKCDPAPTEPDCATQKRFEGWYEKYNDQVDYWEHALLFNTNIFFASRKVVFPSFNSNLVDHEHEKWLGHSTPNLVDAFYSIALRRGQGWAFAINKGATFRLVRRREEREIPPENLEKYAWWLPTSLPETAEYVAVHWAFEEADLTQCENGLKHLRAFPAQRPHPLWDEEALEWSLNFVEKPAQELLYVSADGDGVFVRAKGVLDKSKAGPSATARYVIYDQNNGGEAYDWAKEMVRIVKPCLRPSDAPPPWELYREAESGGS